MRITVFLVDDHNIIRKGLRAILESEPDIEVVGECREGRRALNRVEVLQPDIVMMDISMPDMNGLAATQRICDMGLDTKVIILTMHSTMTYVRQALQSGAQGFLLKETAGVEVVEAMRKVHTGHRYLSPKITDQMIGRCIEHHLEEGPVNPLQDLTPREREVLQLVAEGRSSQYIAEALSLAPATVTTYRSRLMRKMGFSSLAKLVRFAIQHGLTPLE
jgi:DNA-binding NarL/FixJ family response regulator